MKSTTCLICGDSGRVATRLAGWNEPVGGRAYDAIPRCLDPQACRSRVEAIGEEWPLLDPTDSRPQESAR